jgi:hypothetical protein
MTFRKIVVFLIIGLVGCTQQAGEPESPAGSEVRVADRGRIRFVKIVPQNPDSNTNLDVEVVYGGGGTKVAAYQWLVNEAHIPGAVQATLSSRDVRRGDSISVQVWEEGREDPVVSRPVLIDNSPPVIEWVGIEPYGASSSTDLHRAVKSSDGDGDELSFSYEWSVNGEKVIDQEGPSLASEYFKRGDRVRLTVTPHDGIVWGDAVTSDALVITNGPPKIVSTPPEQLGRQGIYRYEVKAGDADGDSLRFSLQGDFPEGMTIDPETGVVEWEVVLPDQAVDYVYKVVAEDPDGAKSIQEITLKYAP